MVWKNYSSLDEALKEIDYNEKSTCRNFAYTKPNFSAFEKDLGDTIRSFMELTENKSFSEDVCLSATGVLGELIVNAYQHSLEDRRGDKCEGIMYVSDKGFVLGTKQSSNFIPKNKIESIRQGKQISSVANDDPQFKSYLGKRGDGWSCYMMAYGSGVFIDEESKAVYVLLLAKDISDIFEKENMQKKNQ